MAARPLIYRILPEFGATRRGPAGFPMTVHIGQDALRFTNGSTEPWTCRAQLGFREKDLITFGVEPQKSHDVSYGELQALAGDVDVPFLRRAAREKIRLRVRRTVKRDPFQDFRLIFDLQPTLEGKLLRLRPLQPEDWDDLYAVASDPLIWELHPHKDRYKEEVFKEFFRDALASGGALIAVDSKDGRVIGSSRFHGYDKDKSEIEIGWTFLSQVPLGRPLQSGNETAHAATRFHIREERCLSC